MKFMFQYVEAPPSVDPQDWNNWTWQLRSSLKSESDFSEVFDLSSEERAGFSGSSALFSVRTTPYYASLASLSNEKDPIRRILMPSQLELMPNGQQMLDPLGEQKNNPVRRIIHRYSDRVLFLVTDICSVYCRYCTRKHFTGQDQAFIKPEEFNSAIEYMKTHPGIREVILSGGDPLTLSDEHLEKVLYTLRSIDHVEIIRIGSRMPVVCPMRVTENLVKVLRKYQPVFMMTHFNHPKELTVQSAEALSLFVDHGIPVFNQMVLLNGINNHPAIVQALSRRLLYLRVKPYYMFQCDPSQGTDHFRTSIEESESILRELWGHLSGLAMPNLSLDIPDGGGKVALTPNFETQRTTQGRQYIGWDGVPGSYSNPNGEVSLPPDFGDYVSEWNTLRDSKLTRSSTVS